MKQFLLFVLPVILAGAAGATGGLNPADPPRDVLSVWQEAPETIFDASGVDPAEFEWRARPVVVFADTPADPRFQTQMDLILDGIDDLVARDVVIVTDTDPGSMSAWREALRPRGFMLVLVGKDGFVKLRKPLPWDMRELSRVIDKMPMRQQEIRDQRLSRD